MSRKSSDRKGIIVYFDALPSLAKMTVEGQARFLLACLNYGATGELTDLSDLPLETRIRLETLLEQTFPRMDADAEKWKMTIFQRKYAAYCRQQREAGEEAVSFDAYLDWAERAGELGIPGAPL